MPNEKEFVPAKRQTMLILLSVLLAAILLLAGILHHILSSPTAFSPEGYTVGMDGLQYQIETTTQGGYISITGWAILEDHRFIDWDTRVILYNTQDKSYLQLPTQLQERDDIPGAGAPNFNFALGGFEADVAIRKLKEPASQYEVCILFAPLGHGHLVHTGTLLPSTV